MVTMKTRILNLFFILMLIAYATPKKLYSMTNTKTMAYTETEAKALMLKHLPHLYFHADEKYFPTAIEDFNIDWSTVTLDDKDAEVDLNGYKGNTSLIQSVPVYTSILQNDDGTTRISYLFLYAWNEKGPRGHIKAKVVGLGVDKSWTWGDYGLGLHYSDVEHIEVYLKSSGEVDYVIYSMHSFTAKVTISGNNPKVYVAKGSHGSYSSTGLHTYLTVWDEDKKVLGKTVYDTHLKFEDVVDNNTKLWISTNPRLLKLNGAAVSDISNAENYLAFKYSGRLGVRYTNTYWQKLTDYAQVEDIVKFVKKFSNSVGNKIEDKWNELRDSIEAEATASRSFYGRSFW